MGFFASVNGIVTPRRGGPRLRPRQRLHVRRQRLRDAAHLRGPALRARDATCARLRASAGRLGIAIPLPDDELLARLDALLARAANPESYIRIIVSRGVGDISYHFERVKGPTVVMVVKPYEPLPGGALHRGHPGGPRLGAPQPSRRPSTPPSSPATCSTTSWPCARRRPAAREEAILLNEQGEMAEGASSNVFVVRGRHRAHAAARGRHPGRHHARGASWRSLRGLGAPGRARSRSEPEDLLGADEAFITSTLKEVVPIRDGRRTAGGRRPARARHPARSWRRSASTRRGHCA